MTPKIAMLLLIIFLVSLGACLVSRSGGNRYTMRDKAGNNYQVMRMSDGKDWTIQQRGSAISAREGQRFIFKMMGRKPGLLRSVV